jgi:hypothetical protein
VDVVVHWVVEVRGRDVKRSWLSSAINSLEAVMMRCTVTVLLRIAGRAQMEITAGGWMWATVCVCPQVCGRANNIISALHSAVWWAECNGLYVPNNLITGSKVSKE